MPDLSAMTALVSASCPGIGNGPAEEARETFPFHNTRRGAMYNGEGRTGCYTAFAMRLQKPPYASLRTMLNGGSYTADQWRSCFHSGRNGGCPALTGPECV
jgi:hypothetical protein